MLKLRYKMGIEKLIEFKSQRIKDEWESKDIDKRLRIVFYAFIAWRFEEFGKTTKITHLKRIQQEQDEFYRNDTEYQKKKFMSVHQVSPCRGLDVQVWDWTEEERKKSLKWVNRNFIYGGSKSCLLIHSVGYGLHGHFQVPYNTRIC